MSKWLHIIGGRAMGRDNPVQSLKMKGFHMTGKFIIVLAAVMTLSGCAAMIKGVGNSNIYGELPPQGTFAVQQLDGDTIVGKRIERMISHQVAKQGYTPSEKSPDLLVSFAFDISPAGAVSTAYTTINRAPQTSYVNGNTVRVNSSSSTASTRISTTQLYQKAIAVRISRALTGEKIWDATVSETGWCNQIFVTSPQILTVMFDGFPNEMINVQKTVTSDDSGTRELRNLFPPETNWGCQKN